MYSVYIVLYIIVSHSYTDGAVNRARLQPARQERLLRDTFTLG